MDSSVRAILLLNCYLVIVLSAVAISIVRCPLGWRRWILYSFTKLYCGLGYHWRSNRRCVFPDQEGALVIANHRSPLDPPLVWVNNHLRHETGPPRGISFLMASEYYSAGGIVGWISRAMESVPVERNGRDSRATREAIRRLQAGELIGIFPEGGINLSDDLLPGSPGVAFLALKARVPVIPIYIHNAPLGESMVEPFYRFQRVRILYGDPIDLSPWYGVRADRALLELVTQEMMSRIADLQRQALSDELRRVAICGG